MMALIPWRLVKWLSLAVALVWVWLMFEAVKQDAGLKVVAVVGSGALGWLIVSVIASELEKWKQI